MAVLQDKLRAYEDFKEFLDNFTLYEGDIRELKQVVIQILLGDNDSDISDCIALMSALNEYDKKRS